MSDLQVIKNRQYFEIAGSLLCGLILGYVLWILSLPSDGEITTADHLALALYLISSGSCFIGSFWLLNRYYIVSAEALSLRWIYICLIGTSLVVTVDATLLFLKNKPDDLSNFIVSSLTRLLIFMGLMLPIMAIVVSVGVILGRIRKLAGKQRLIDTHGI